MDEKQVAEPGKLEGARISGGAEKLWSCKRIDKNANPTEFRSLCGFQRKNIFVY